MQTSGSPNEQNEKATDKEAKKPEIASWTKFFKRFRFFGKHFRNFIRIDIVANSVDGKNDNYLEWLGFVESKLFILLNYISKEEQISEIRAYPYSFKNKQAYELGLMDTEISKFQFVDTYFFGFTLFCQGPHMNMAGPYGRPPAQPVIQLADHCIQFCQKLDFGRIQKASTDVRILHVKREDLPAELVKNY
jgi:hypothetical protein